MIIKEHKVTVDFSHDDIKQLKEKLGSDMLNRNSSLYVEISHRLVVLENKIRGMETELNLLKEFENESNNRRISKRN